jgi:UDP-3-O-[3-hydroxymyristoyl] N-acetylglucosamine deacetylase
MQRTISRVVRTGGIGLHTGKDCLMTLYPAPEDSGIVFVHNRVQLPALILYVSSTKLATTLSNEGVSVMTVEHLLAALYSKRIDNCFIHLSEKEVPAMDGSSEPFIQLIEEAGTELQNGERKYLQVKKRIEIKNGDSFVYIMPYEHLRVDCSIRYDHPSIGKQEFAYDQAEHSFTNAISYARTFGFEKDIEKMQSEGYALGGSVDNAIVLTENGILNKDGLRYNNEFARHKIIDAIGDLYLSGYEIRGLFYGYKSGHSLNIQLVRKLLSDESAYEIVIS